MFHEFNAGAPGRRGKTGPGSAIKTYRRGARNAGGIPRNTFLRISGGYDRDAETTDRFNASLKSMPGRRAAGKRQGSGSAIKLNAAAPGRRGNTEKYLFENFRWLRQGMRRQRIGSMLHEFNAGAPSRREKQSIQHYNNSTPRAEVRESDAMDVRSFNAAPAGTPKKTGNQFRGTILNAAGPSRREKTGPQRYKNLTPRRSGRRGIPRNTF